MLKLKLQYFGHLMQTTDSFEKTLMLGKIEGGGSSLKTLVRAKGTQAPAPALYLVVEACAMIFPPIGFLGSAANMAAPSTWATTWLVITTATPN